MCMSGIGDGGLHLSPVHVYIDALWLFGTHTRQPLQQHNHSHDDDEDGDDDDALLIQVVMVAETIARAMAMANGDDMMVR